MPLAIQGILLIVTLAALGGWYLTHGKAQDTPVKVMMFVGYFWLLAFLQLLLFAAGYYLRQYF
ncbi:hypothetical protein KEF85_04125 [Methylomonas paludis]|uniref:Uncharacterized protein n=1 Tax=Methylomonas paludis TaxID=1173101 RepID=A0A975MPJ9_9GAMM|nr:hypothetical protein [Methylomonas paludis]QWF71671.1 hypothetical protein KEF85_04125 [Methylomonas paludis]